MGIPPAQLKKRMFVVSLSLSVAAACLYPFIDGTIGGRQRRAHIAEVDALRIWGFVGLSISIPI